VARYIEKNEADIAWNEIRRRVTYQANLAAANWKERKLNEILPQLQIQFEAALQQGEILELESSEITFED
jgi:hypothetical protein